MRRMLACLLICALLASSSPLAFASDAAPVAGDLSHLTFTATSNLWVKLISPIPESAMDIPAAAVEAAVGMGQGVEVRINGEIVPTTKIGKRVVDGPANQTRYTFYGVPLQPGSNQLVLTPLGAGALRGKSVAVVLYGPGPAAAFQVAITGKYIANGTSLLLLRVKATDQWGHPALVGSLVKASIVSGDIQFLPAVVSTPMPTPAAPSNAPASPIPSVSPSPAASPSPVAPTSLAIGTAVTKPVPALAYMGISTPTPTSSPALVIVGATPLPAVSLPPVVVDARDHANLLGGLLQSVDLMLERGGIASVNMLAGLKAGDVVVRISEGALTFDRTFFLAPNVRAPLVVGLATVGIGAVPGTPGEDPTVVDGSNTRRGRVALYGSGDVGHQILGTIVYDTADTLANSTGFSSFGQSDMIGSRPYQIVGDSSVPRNDALSNDHLYLRFDRNRSNAVWGEFQAQTGSSDGGDGFNLLVDGAKIELASTATKLMVFNARNNIAYARQIFNPLGLATLGNLLHPNIVVGSDIVTLVTLNRNSGAILQQTTLTPNIDYSIDYNTGQIRFVNIPLPFDPSFNPNQIVVQYEYDGVLGNAQTSGGRFEAAFGHASKEHVSVGYANDANGTSNFSLLSENLGGVLPGGAWSLEHLGSNGVVAGDEATHVLGVAGTNGSALRMAVHAGSASNKFEAGFDATTAGFNNPFGGLSTPGLLDYHAIITHMLQGGRGQVTLSVSHAQNSGPIAGTSSQSQASLLWQEKFTKRFSLKGGLSGITGPGAAAVAVASAAPVPAPAPASVTSLQGDIGFDWLLLPKIDLTVDRTQNIGSGVVASQPAQTNAQLGIEFTRKGRAYIREMWSAAPVQSFANATASLTAPVSGTHTTAFGFQRSLGAATALDTEYSIQQTPTGKEFYSATGLDEKLQFGKRLRGDANVQHAIGIGSGTSGFNLYGLTMSYELPRLRVSESYQLRTADGGGSSLRLGATGNLSPDFTLLALVDDSSAAGLVSNDRRIGLAYRPTRNDSGVTLLQYELATSTSAELGTYGATLSLDQAFRPLDRLTLAGRFAYKLTGDAYYPARTELIGVRAVLRVDDIFDVGSEMQYLGVRGISGASALGVALESGVRLGDGMRLAVGYNFSAAPDPALISAPTRRGIYATLSTVIDRILGWGR